MAVAAEQTNPDTQMTRWDHTMRSGNDLYFVRFQIQNAN